MLVHPEYNINGNTVSCDAAPDSLPFCNTGATDDLDIGWLKGFIPNVETELMLKPDAVRLGAVACDYLRVTTFDVAAFAPLAGALLGYVGLGDQGNLWQYQGIRGNGYFIGWGVQQKDGSLKQHYIIDVSGFMAQQFLELVLSVGGYKACIAMCKCTRFDVQITDTEDTSEDLLDLGMLGRILRASDWECQSKRPRIDVFDKQDDLSTLYIGSRTSQRIQRIYNKKLNYGVHLRWETEFKGVLAVKALDSVLAAGLQIQAAMLLSEMSIVPDAPELEHIRDLVASFGQERMGRLSVVKDATDDFRRLSWLRSTVLASVKGISERINGRIGSEKECFLIYHALRYWLGDLRDLIGSLSGGGSLVSRGTSPVSYPHS